MTTRDQLIALRRVCTMNRDVIARILSPARKRGFHAAWRVKREQTTFGYAVVSDHGQNAIPTIIGNRPPRTTHRLQPPRRRVLRRVPLHRSDGDELMPSTGLVDQNSAQRRRN